MHGPNGEGSLSSIFQTFLQFLSNYGWIFASVITLYFLFWGRISRWWNSSQSDSSPVQGESDHTKNALQLQESRRKMQEQYDALARVHAEKVKEKEEEKRRQCLEELERNANMGGRRLGRESDSTPSAPSGLKKKPLGPRMREDNYNPLTGAGGVGGFRSSRGGCGPRGG